MPDISNFGIYDLYYNSQNNTYFAEVYVNAQSVPDATSTLALFAIGMTALAGMHRRI